MIKRFCLLLSFGLVVSGFAPGQQYYGKQAETLLPDATTVDYLNPTNAPSCLIFKEGKVSEANFFAKARQVLKMQFPDTWKKIRTDRDDLQMSHHRYQQYYNGIRVEQGEYILHEKNNALVSANGVFYDGINIPVIPVYQEAQALKNALADVHAKRYKWEMPEEEALLKKTEKNNLATYFPKAELVITNAALHAEKPDFHLAYKFDVYADEPMSRQYIYVDAANGKIIKRENRICEFAVTGTLTTKYSGVKNLVTDSVGPGSYRLHDITRGGGVETYNMNSQTNYGLAVDFTDTDNIWNTLANQDNAAYDAHYGAQMTYDYYLNVHNRNSYDNLGSPFRSYVHFFTNYNNAFWNGTVMSYGDGNGLSNGYSPLTPLDVCGHELSHGVTANSSALVYSFESGALNESFSDIFAACVDFFANPGGANFQIGEQCYTPGISGDAIRSMSNPNSEGDPDTYLGTNWFIGATDNGGVHTNSGVQNFWFYLLCQGGTGTNDIGFNYNVSAIGINDARLIAYRNNNFYLTSGSQYADARTYSIMAAGDIFGPCSAQQVAVKNAWDAVGVTGIYNPLPFITSLNNSPLCPGTNLNLSSSGGVSYSWTGPGGYTSTAANPVIANVQASQAGNYTVEVTDANGCTGTKTTNVYLHTSPSVTSSAGVTICASDSTNLTSSGLAFGAGGPPVSNTSSTVFNIPDNNTTGISSSITVTNQGNANQIISITIDSLIHSWAADLNFYLIAPNLSQIPLALGVGNSGDNFLHTTLSSTASNVIGSVNNNTTPFTGTYAPQTPFSSLTGSANGIWKLKVVDVISQDVGILYGWTITLSGPNGIVSYSWSPVNGLNSTAVQNPKTAPGSTTTYNVMVTDLRGCTASSSTTINVNNLNLSHLSNNVSCNGNTNGQVDLSVAGGTGPYLFNWSNGSSTEDIGSLGVGTYTVTVTDAIGCTKTHNAVISQPAVLSSTASLQHPLCNNGNNGALMLNVTGGSQPYTYSWSNGTTTRDQSGLSPGSYTVSITDANGCTNTGSYILVNPVAVALNNSVTPVSCFGGSNGNINLTVNGGTGPYSFSWSNSSTNEDIGGLTAGNYQVLVTDVNGCTANQSVQVTQPAVISISSQNSSPPCSQPSGGQIDLTVTGGSPGYTYLWSNGATTQDLIALTTGIYSVTVHDVNGCTASFQTNLAGPVLFNVSSGVTPVSCNGGSNGSAQLSITGGNGPFAFNWSDGNTNQNRTALSAGSYTVTVTDGNGCTKTNSVLVSEPALIAINGVAVNPLCSGNSNGTVDLTVNGGISPYGFLWSNGASSEDISNLGAGTYFVTIMDMNGCIANGSYIIATPPALLLNSQVQHVACFGGNNGALNITPNGGVSPYTYSWSNGSTNEDIAGLSAGNYQVTINDVNGCQLISGFAVNQPAQVSVSSVNTNPSCSQPSGGQINVTASGGTGGYSYLWSNGSTAEDLINLPGGNYSVTITDANGCTKSYQATLIASASLSVTPVINQVTCNGLSNGVIQLSVSGGTSPFTYSWSDGNTGQQRTGLAPGTYTVNIFDNSGCSSSQNYAITQPPVLTLSTTKTDLRCKGGNDGAINLSVSGGTAGYTYLWNTGATTEDINNLVKNTYTVTVTDANGCISTKVTALTQPASVISISSSKTNPRCPGSLTGVITLTVSGGVGPYNYAWNTIPVKTTASVSGLAAGSYECTVTDAAGCEKVITILLTQPPVIVILTTQSNVTVPGGNNGSASATASGGTGPYTYSWNTIPVTTTSSVTGLSAGIYTVKVTDSKGCTKNAVVTISAPAPRPVEFHQSNLVSDMMVYPNPNEGMIMLSMESSSVTAGYFSVFDYTGKLVFRIKEELIPGNNHFRFDLTYLPKGLYLVQFTTADYKNETKIVLQ